MTRDPYEELGYNPDCETLEFQTGILVPERKLKPSLMRNVCQYQLALHALEHNRRMAKLQKRNRAIVLAFLTLVFVILGGVFLI